MSDFVECPWCGKRLTDLWDYGWRSDEESIVVECEHCEHEIDLARSVSVSYEARRVEPKEGREPCRTGDR